MTVMGVCALPVGRCLSVSGCVKERQRNLANSQVKCTMTEQREGQEEGRERKVKSLHRGGALVESAKIGTNNPIGSFFSPNEAWTHTYTYVPIDTQCIHTSRLLSSLLESRILGAFSCGWRNGGDLSTVEASLVVQFPFV